MSPKSSLFLLCGAITALTVFAAPAPVAVAAGGVQPTHASDCDVSGASARLREVCRTDRGRPSRGREGERQPVPAAPATVKPASPAVGSPSSTAESADEPLCTRVVCR